MKRIFDYEQYKETENRSRNLENVFGTNDTCNQLFQLLVTSFKYNYTSLVAIVQLSTGMKQ